MSGNEQDIRLDIYNAMLVTPHFSKASDRVKKEFIDRHREYYALDPLFYSHLSVWYNGDEEQGLKGLGGIRDHGEIFVATMLTSDDMEHRDAGFVMFKQLEPYRVANVVQFMKKFYGRVPRSARTAVIQYLREREAKPHWFDSAITGNRKHFKYLYATLHIKPSERANRILFLDDPPEDSKAFQVKALDKAKDSKEQAELIVKYRIPYTVAIGAVSEVTPVILVALVNAMSPQQVINNLGSLKKKGAMKNDDIKALIEAKLEKAKTNKRVAGGKAKVAADAAGVDDEIREKLEAVTDERAKARGVIKRPTALLVDKSGSLQVAIDVGKAVAKTVAGVCEGDFYVYAFDKAPFPIQATGKGVSAWDKAFRHIRAVGGTSVGSGFAALAASRQFVEQVIIVTDEQENAAPFSDTAYEAYASAMNVRPDVHIVKVGSHTTSTEQRLARVGASVETLEFEGDYYALDNLVPLLAAPSRLELLLEIMSVPLPVRKDIVRPELEEEDATA